MTDAGTFTKFGPDPSPHEQNHRENVASQRAALLLDLPEGVGNREAGDPRPHSGIGRAVRHLAPRVPDLGVQVVMVAAPVGEKDDPFDGNAIDDPLHLVAHSPVAGHHADRSSTARSARSSSMSTAGSRRRLLQPAAGSRQDHRTSRYRRTGPYLARTATGRGMRGRRSRVTGPVSAAHSSQARRSGRRVSNARYPRAQGGPDRPQGPRPVLVGEEDLGHVPGHHREVGGGGRYPGGIFVGPR
jgi:hypothetical protein